MRNFPRGRKGESQISDYIRLGAILQKERSPLKQEAVDAVLRSRASLRDKIEKINHIDEAAERYAPPPAPAKKPAAEPEPDPMFGQTDEEELSALRLAKRNQLKLVRLQAETRFLPFLFREYGLIKRFGAKSGVLDFGFPCRMALSKEGLESIASDVERVDLRALGAVLAQIVQNGWRVLEKYEYNCVVALYEYCRCLAGVGIHALDRHDRFLIHRLKELERLYLVLHSSPAVRAAVFAALDKLIDHAPGRETQTRECAERVRTLLAESDSRPTVGGLILGLNMLRWRRFFTMADLADRSEGNLFCGAAFDCPDDVRLAINEFIEKHETRLKNLVREQAGLDREIEFFPKDENGEVVYRELSRFYCRQADPEKIGTWARDTDQILFFLARVVDLYIANFRPLLCEPVAFEPTGSGCLFDSALFDSDLDLLARAQKQLERHTFSFGGMTRSRYQEIRGTHQTATRIEAEAFSIVTEILSRLHALAQKLTSRLAPPGPAGADDANAPDGGSGPIAHGDKVIRGESLLAGKTVSAALRYAVSIAFGIGLYLSDPSLWGILRRETPLKAEFEGIMRSLQRIAPARIFNDLQKRYVIP
jgi:hypothetical protein